MAAESSFREGPHSDSLALLLTSANQPPGDATFGAYFELSAEQHVAAYVEDI